MDIFRNEKGLTLLEVLISIVILSIILLSTMSLFPQMGFINKENVDKTKAINNAKDLLIEWENSYSVKNYLKNNKITSLPGYYKTDSNFYYCKSTTGNFDVFIKIKTKTDLVSTPIETRLINIQLLNKRNNVVGETYGYILLNE
jgi:prepilin-type N-terminal cleavage/methylation domain-containing protein